MPTAAVLAVASIASAASQRSAARSAQRRQERALREGREITATSGAQARGDVLRLFGQAQEQQALGFQQAQQLFGQTIPQQANVFQAGNVAAQQQLLAGLPLFQSAILGGPLDFSTLQPTQLQQPDFGVFAQFAGPEPEPEPEPATFGPRFTPGQFLRPRAEFRGGLRRGFRGLPLSRQAITSNINQGGI